MGNIKVAILIALSLALPVFFLKFPLYVSISFDLERDPPAINQGMTSFEGVGKVADILDILERHDARGTFFFTGRVVERFPTTVLDIWERGHEVAAHGGFYHDESIFGLPAGEQKEKISRTKKRIETITGVRVQGYRAPGHRIDKATFIALKELGFAYDSSIVPGIGGWVLYNHMIFSPVSPYRPNIDGRIFSESLDFLEIPISPLFINGNLDSLLAYQGQTITKIELFFTAVKCKIQRRPMVLYLHPGLMVDLPNEPSDYRSGEYLMDEFDDALSFLDMLGARYVALEEIKSL